MGRSSADWYASLARARPPWRRRTTAARVAEVLTAAVASAPPGAVELRPRDGAALVEAAATHRVVGYARRALGDSDQLDDLSSMRLTQLSVDGVMQHLRAMADLRRLAAVLDGSGARWAALKGPVAAQVLHGDGDLRRYVDLDVVVSPADLPAVVERLEDEGAQVTDRRWLTLLAWQHAQIHLRLWSGTLLDLHWHVLNERWDRQAFDLDTEAMLARVRRVDVGGFEVPTLDAADTLVHLCVHAASAGGQRLLWLRDIQLAANASELDWEVLARRARQGRTALVTAVMLRLAGEVLGDAAVTAHARRLTPSRSWLAVVGVAAVLSHPARWRGREHVTLGTVLCRATRGDVRRSVITTARSLPRLLRRWTTSERVRDALRPVRDALGRLLGRGAGSGEVVRSGDGPHARGAYFAWVRSVSGRSPDPPAAP